jgi:hypothetical protein
MGFFILIMVSRNLFAQDVTYSTIEEALENVVDPSWELIEIIDKRIYEEDNYGYIFFYSQLSEPKEYYVVAEFKKEKNGWSFENMFGGGPIKIQEGGASHYSGGYEDGEQFGLANPDVISVRLGNREADLIPLDQKDLKIWFFYKPTLEDVEHEPKFYDENGELF